MIYLKIINLLEIYEILIYSKLTMNVIKSESYYDVNQDDNTEHNHNMNTDIKHRLVAGVVQNNVTQCLSVTETTKVVKPQNTSRRTWKDKEVLIGLAIMAVTAIAVLTISGWVIIMVKASASQWLQYSYTLAKSPSKNNLPDMQAGSILTQDNNNNIIDNNDQHDTRASEHKREYGLPTSLWQLMNVDLYRTTWFVAAVQSHPRMAIFYLYCFDYTGSFLPLVHSVCPINDMQSDVMDYENKQEPTTTIQLVNFSCRWTVFPYIGVFGNFIWKNVWNYNTLVTLWLLNLLLHLTIHELLWIVSSVANPVRLGGILMDWLSVEIRQACLYIAAYQLWHFIPTVIIYCYLFVMLILAPIGVMSAVVKLVKPFYKKLRSTIDRLY